MITKSARETAAFARAYAATLRPGDVLLLHGEMGAGKTVFVKGLAEGLGIEEEITSPTYAYMNDYGGKLYHFDCYSLAGGAQADALGLTAISTRAHPRVLASRQSPRTDVCSPLRLARTITMPPS